jgi:hypothetical protein
MRSSTAFVSNTPTPLRLSDAHISWGIIFGARGADFPSNAVFPAKAGIPLSRIIFVTVSGTPAFAGVTE